jgi:hypothetical protein
MHKSIVRRAREPKAFLGSFVVLTSTILCRQCRFMMVGDYLYCRDEERHG